MIIIFLIFKLKICRDECLRSSLICGVKAQELIVQEAIATLNRKVITSYDKFRDLVLESGNNLHILSHPIAICELTRILYQCETEQRKQQKKPMMISVLKPQSNSYIVNGLFELPTNEKERNLFPLWFERAASITNSRILNRFHQQSCIEIQKDDFFKFHESLVQL